MHTKINAEHIAETNNSESELLTQFIETEQEVNSLPELSAVERVKLDQDIAIDHLYYSSRIEGTQLSDKRLGKAINA